MALRTEEKTQKEYNNLQWLKSKLNTLLKSPKFCALCLESDGQLYKLEKEFAPNKNVNSMPLRDVVDLLFNFHIEDMTPSGYICEKCTEKVIHFFMFIEDTKKLFKIIDNCITDINSKVIDIDNELDIQDYADSNVMVVLEYDTHIYNQIDELTSNNNAILSDVPLKVKEEHKKPALPNFMPLNKNNELNKNKNEPVIKPTPRMVKYPRTKEIVPIKHIETETPQTPITLQEGKLVIEPLITNGIPAAPRFNTYACNSCSNIFTTNRSLKEHEKAIHNNVIFKCRFCDKVYNTQQYLNVHYLTIHSKAYCKFCYDLFDEGTLNSHLRKDHEHVVNSCEFCDLVYYSAEELETHMKSSHFNQVIKSKGKTDCIMCLRSLNDVQLKNHKCKFACLDCPSVPCIHHSYLTSYREQILNHAPKIRCIDCDYTTKRKEHLISHVNREHLDYHPFTCDHCRTQFYTKLSLKIHIVQFHQDLKCEFCDFEFKTSKSYENHRNICKSTVRSYACDECVASFDNEIDLEKHISMHHSEFVYPCTLCKKQFHDKSSLEVHHARVHSGIQYKKRSRCIECTLCDITFRNLKEMLEHEKIHDTSETFPCNVCPKIYNSLKKVYIHKQRHYRQRTNCPGCMKLPGSATYKRQHIDSCSYSKNKECTYVCEICGSSFRSETTLKSHMRLHKKAECNQCGVMIKVGSMKKHIESKHPVLEPCVITADQLPKPATVYKCRFCGYTTKKRFELENHVNKVHLKIKPYVCEVCNKAFCGKIRLNDHKKIHSTKQECFCVYCGKKYANKVCLKMHYRTHTGENPYQCNVCFKRFRSSSIMKAHRLKKHQDKTISCPLCDSMFHLAIEMRHHVKKAHWKKDTPFDFKEIVPEEYHHLFHDQRLQKLGNELLVF